MVGEPIIRMSLLQLFISIAKTVPNALGEKTVLERLQEMHDTIYNLQPQLDT